jgi:hypothetical protein
MSCCRSALVTFFSIGLKNSPGRPVCMCVLVETACSLHYCLATAAISNDAAHDVPSKSQACCIVNNKHIKYPQYITLATMNGTNIKTAVLSTRCTAPCYWMAVSWHTLEYVLSADSI